MVSLSHLNYRTSLGVSRSDLKLEQMNTTLHNVSLSPDVLLFEQSTSDVHPTVYTEKRLQHVKCNQKTHSV